MERNFAQIVFLLYGIILLYTSRKGIELIVKRKMGEAAYRRKTQGAINSLCYLLLKRDIAPVLFHWNLITVILLSLCAVGHMTLGWFSPFATVMKLLNSLSLLFAAVQAFALSLARNVIRYGEMFLLYRVEEDEATGKKLVSSVLDAILMLLLPLLMILCNFFAL